MRLAVDVPSDRARYRHLAAKERQLIERIQAEDDTVSACSAGEGADTPPRER